MFSKRVAMIKDLSIGGNNPIRVQTMYDSQICDTDVDEVIRRIKLLAAMGCDIIRFSYVSSKDKDNFTKICQLSPIPVVADIHFDYKLAIEALRCGAPKIRINPGNIGPKWKSEEVIKAAKDYNAAVRIGLNSGSLPHNDKNLDTPTLMVDTALEYLSWFEAWGFDNSVISLKASDPEITLEANRKLSKMCDYPIHIGVTEAGGIVGIVGPNGAGKTTLFKMIVEAASKTEANKGMGGTGELPDAGTIKIGQTVKLVYVDQLRSNLDENKTVYETLSGGSDLIKLGAVDEKGRPLEGGVREVNAHAYCGWFNFGSADQNKKVAVLSGGERNRLNLGLMLQESGNVLLFDEPTNDLDVQTVRALEDALEDFAGCAMVVSHDRWFLDRICTHILAFENNSTVRFYEGNWSEYAEWKMKEFGEDVGVPKRTVYRKLTR